MAREDNRTDPQLKLRIPVALKRKLDAAAQQLHRPVGNEIIARLEASFANEEPSAKGLGGVFARAAKNSQLNLVHRVDELQLIQRGQMAVQEEMRTQFSELADRVSKLEQKK